jgi:hypothetical protein
MIRGWITGYWSAAHIHTQRRVPSWAEEYLVSEIWDECRLAPDQTVYWATTLVLNYAWRWNYPKPE